MAITRYDPWGMLDQLRREMDRVFEGHSEEGGVSATDWVPAVDIREDADAFVITADVPGVDPKRIEISAENGMLAIKGERDVEKKERREGYKRVERTFGTFFRRFSLPDTANTEQISARSQNGVLEIRIPKHERLQPRKITVEG